MNGNGEMKALYKWALGGTCGLLMIVIGFSVKSFAGSNSYDHTEFRKTLQQHSLEIAEFRAHLNKLEEKILSNQELILKKLP